jgi:hypothetical protein
VVLLFCWRSLVEVSAMREYIKLEI